MKLTEVKTERHHCFKDEDRNVHGLYQSWHHSGAICWQTQYNHGRWHGEYKFFHEDGSLAYHMWHEHNKLILDFLNGDKYPTTPEEIFIHKLTYKGEFIPSETEIKAKYEYYFRDEDGKYHGLYQYWYDSGAIRWQTQYNHGRWHGEYKIFYEDGSLFAHGWYEHDKQVLNFLKGDKYPVDEEELLIFKLTHQGEFLPK